MPKSVLLRPAEAANADELTVFNCLSSLDTSWHVVWGYYSQENGEEGDFLILGPNGGLMVLEVKGFESLAVDPEGNWRGRDGTDNPFLQLDGLWTWVKDHVNGATQADGLPSLHLVRALAVPNVTRNDLNQLPAIGPRDAHILTLRELENFEAAWNRAFAKVDQRFYPNVPARERFFATDPGSRFRTHPEQVYESLLDLDLDRLTRASMDWLDYLEEDYERYAIRGGPGSGKSWILMRLALRFLRMQRLDGEPRRVLMLCYNKPLARHLKLLAQRLFKSEKLTHAEKDRFEVLSWETLLAKQLRLADTYQEPPDKKSDFNGFQTYYKEWLPKAGEELVACDALEAQYDALLVDEAQDHTNAAMGDFMPDGWWTLYGGLLNQPETDPIAVAFDCDQVQRFTDNRFDADKLREWLGAKCAHLRLKTNLRCTKEIHDYLRSLEGDGTIRFPLPRSEALCPKGPEVEVRSAEGKLMQVLEPMIKEWLESKHYVPDDLLIAGPFAKHSSTGVHDQIAGVKVRDFTKRKPGEIAYVSAAACKGIESRVVILVGYGAYETLSADYRHAFCLAASRARVRLVVIRRI